MAMQLESKSEEETKEIARKFYSTVKEGDIVLLSGELGAGKTTFVKGVVESAGYDPASCPSPTFTLISQFKKIEPSQKNILHIDLYRLDNEKEIEELLLYEIMEYINTYIIFIEWGEKIANILHRYNIKFKKITFQFEGMENRKLIFE